METTNKTCIYVIFSRTPYKMGSFIRTVTRGEYGHVSVSFDPELCEMYSFSRLYEETPFNAGFVHEGVERYHYGDKIAEIAVCRVPVSENGMTKVRERIDDMTVHSNDYVYNLISAVATPWRHYVPVRDSYTCLEFVLSILKLADFPLSDSYYSISDLYSLLKKWEVYNGVFPETVLYEDENYSDHIPVRKRVTGTARQIFRLTLRFVRR